MTSVEEDRVLRADAYPIGIDYERFNDAAAHSPEVDAERRKILEILQGRKLVFSVDRLDYSKGFLHRLAAFEWFLESYPEWREQVRFCMVVIPSRDTIAAYQRMKREIEAEVGRINGKYGTLAWVPILYQYRSLSFPELIAIYSLSDSACHAVAGGITSCQGSSWSTRRACGLSGAGGLNVRSLLINLTDGKAASHHRRDIGTECWCRMRTGPADTVFSWAEYIGTTWSPSRSRLREGQLMSPSIQAQVPDYALQALHSWTMAVAGPLLMIPNFNPEHDTLSQMSSFAEGQEQRGHRQPAPESCGGASGKPGAFTCRPNTARFRRSLANGNR
jgi:hypothetical protein